MVSQYGSVPEMLPSNPLHEGQNSFSSKALFNAGKCSPEKLNSMLQGLSRDEKKQLIESLSPEELEVFHDNDLQQVSDPEILRFAFDRKVQLLKERSLNTEEDGPLTLEDRTVSVKQHNRLVDKIAKKALQSTDKSNIIENQTDAPKKRMAKGGELSLGAYILEVIKGEGRAILAALSAVGSFFDRHVFTILKTKPDWSSEMEGRILSQNFHDVDIKDLSSVGKSRYEEYSKDADKMIHHLLGMSIAGSIVKHEPPCTSTEEALKRKNNTFHHGGQGLLTSHIEIETVKHLLASGKLTDQERVKVERYMRAIERSLELNQAMRSIRDIDVGEDVAKKEEMQANIGKIAGKLMFMIKNLPEGEPILLDVGHLGHAMRLSLEKREGKVFCTLYDSSGGADLIDTFNSSFGLFKVIALEKAGGLSKTGMEVNLSENQFYAKGEEYLKSILHVSSEIGREEQKAMNEEIKKGGGPFIKFRQLRSKWTRTVETFKSIAPERAKKINVLQRKQATANCYAKRLETAQMHEMGKEVWKKMTPILLQKELDLLLDVAVNDKRLTKEQVEDIRRVDQSILTNAEMEEAALRLSKIDGEPATFNDWLDVATVFYHRIEKARIVKLEGGTHEKYSLKKIEKENIPPRVLKGALLINRYNIFRQKSQKIGVEVYGTIVEVDKKTYLKMLDSNPEALLSKEATRMMNYLMYSRTIKPDTKQMIVALREKQNVLMKKDAGKSVEEMAKRIEGEMEPIEKEETHLQKMEQRFEEEIGVLKKMKVLGRDRKRVEERIATLEDYVKIMHNHRAKLYSAKASLEENLQRLNGLKVREQQLQKTQNSKEVSSRYYVIKDGLEQMGASIQEVRKAVDNSRAFSTKEIAKSEREHVSEFVRSEMKKWNDYQLVADLSTADQRPVSLRKEPPKEGSVTEEVQTASKALYDNLVKMFTKDALKKAERKAVVSFESKSGDFSLQMWDFLEKVKDGTGMEELASIVEQPVENYYKESYVNKLFEIWVRHEKPDFFASMQSRDDLERISEVEKQFRSFVEDHTARQSIDFESAGFSLEVDPAMMESYYPTDLEIGKLMQRKQEAATKIASFVSSKMKKIQVKEEIAPEETKPYGIEDIDQDIVTEGKTHQFRGVKHPFDKNLAREGLSVPNTLSFVQNNPSPQLKDLATKEEVATFIDKSMDYLAKLKDAEALENRNERIRFFAMSVVHTLHQNKNAAVGEKTMTELCQIILEGMKDPETSVNDAALKMGNTERRALIGALLEAMDIQIRERVSSGEGPQVDKRLVSIAKQWERIIHPLPEALAQAIDSWEPVSEEQAPLKLITDLAINLGEAIRRSPIGLEAIDEGKPALQDAVDKWGMEQHIDKADLRRVADQLDLRSGVGLLTDNMLDFYGLMNEEGPYSKKKLGSNEGRELFERAMTEAFSRGTKEEKEKLKGLINELIKNAPKISETAGISVPIEVFLIEMKFSLGIAEALEIHALEAFANELTSEKSLDGTERVFGFCHHVFVTEKKLEIIKGILPLDAMQRDRLIAELATANLALRLILNQANQETLKSLYENKSIRKELKRALELVGEHRQELIEFAKKIEGYPGLMLKECLTDYQTAKKLDGDQIEILEASALDAEGFISLGGGISFDIVHGTLFKGGSVIQMMSESIKNNPDMRHLNLQSLPFKKIGDAYVYSENGDGKVFVVEGEEGRVIIQRKMPVFGQEREHILQYVPDEDILDLPEAVGERLGIKEFWLEESGILYGFDKTNRPLYRLTPGDAGYVLEDAEGLIRCSLNALPSSALFDHLKRFLPSEEILAAKEGAGCFIPALGIRVEVNPQSGDREIKGGEWDQMRLVPSEKGLVIEKILTGSQKEKVENLNKQAKEYEERASDLQKGGALSLLDKSQINKWKGKSRQLLKEAAEIQDRRLIIADKEEIEDGVSSISSHQFSLGHDESLMPKTTLGALRLFQQGTIQARQIMILKHFLQLDRPFTGEEEKALSALKSSWSSRPESKDNLEVALLLNFAAIRNEGLKRELHLQGKGAEASEKTIEYAANAIDEILIKLKGLGFKEADKTLTSLWNAFSIRTALEGSGSVLAFFEKPVKEKIVLQKQTSVNAPKKDQPIRAIKFEEHISYSQKAGGSVVLSQEQQSLLNSLDEIAKANPGKAAFIEQQKRGFYFENFGLFSKAEIRNLFKVSLGREGFCGLEEGDVDALFEWMQSEDEGQSKKSWFSKPDGVDLFRFNGTTKEFFSQNQLRTFLAERGFSSGKAALIGERLQQYARQAALNGGEYHLKGGQEQAAVLAGKVKDRMRELKVERLSYESRIDSVINLSKGKIDRTDLMTAFLLDDFSEVQAALDIKDPNEMQQKVFALRNSIANALFLKTEEDLLRDVKAALSSGDVKRALCLLHTRRGYDLDKLEDKKGDHLLKGDSLKRREQEKKIQRAFLLFESQFGHRLNFQQVTVFNGLLLEDRLDPDKIDAVQARMGFGKSTLMPLIALVRAEGNTLVKLVVPKSQWETNTGELSTFLTQALGKRAIKDDFKRYQIPKETSSEEGGNPRLRALKEAEKDLAARLDKYRTAIREKHILVHAPHVRNSMEAQLKIFLDMLTKTENPEEMKALTECISKMNSIRALNSFTAFDELDATQDSESTDVNFTTGQKQSIDPEEVAILDRIIKTLALPGTDSKMVAAKLCLSRLSIADPQGLLATFITRQDFDKPEHFPDDDPFKGKALYLMRGIFSDDKMWEMASLKTPGTDFGVFFEKMEDGSIRYDMESTNPSKESQDKPPLLVAMPYSAANTPRPQGSQFDNPDVKVIATLRYYLDPKTAVSCHPHLTFMIHHFRQGNTSAFFKNDKGEVSPLYQKIKTVADIEDPFVRKKAEEALFLELSPDLTKFKEILATMIAVKQVQFDEGKANSNRFEKGSYSDQVIGFSGTSGDTSTDFLNVQRDPASDGNMTIGIMGRSENQTVEVLKEKGGDAAAYTDSILTDLVSSMGPKTRTLIDVGGLCKVSNRDVAMMLFDKVVKDKKALEGIIFYDDSTNTRKVVESDTQGNPMIRDFTDKDRQLSDKEGKFFTFYDQAHSRGADIPQMKGAEALITFHTGVTNSDFKQAIMRMRKIIDQGSGQAFRVFASESSLKMVSEGMKVEGEVKTVDIGAWLLEKELKDEQAKGPKEAASELQSSFKSAVLQAQAEILSKLNQRDPPPDENDVLRFQGFVRKLGHLSEFIEKSESDLKAKYGGVEKEIAKEQFVENLKKSSHESAKRLKDLISKAEEDLHVEASYSVPDRYQADVVRILKTRQERLPDRFIIKGGDTTSTSIAEVQSQSQSHSQSQSQSQSQSHSFSQISSEIFEASTLNKVEDKEYHEADLSFLTSKERVRAAGEKRLSHLFFDEEPLFFGSAFLEKSKEGKLLPACRYLIVDNATGNVYLSDGDEASKFKKKQGDFPGFALIDLRKWDETDFVLAGSLDNKNALRSLPHMKKLALLARQSGVQETNTLEGIECSLKEIVTIEELNPSLEVIGEKQEIASLVRFDEWGFASRDSEEIPISFSREGGLAIEIGGRRVLVKDNIVPQLEDKLVKGSDDALLEVAKDIQIKLKELKERKTLLEKKVKELNKEKRLKMQGPKGELQAIKNEQNELAGKLKGHLQVLYKKEMERILFSGEDPKIAHIKAKEKALENMSEIFSLEISYYTALMEDGLPKVSSLYQVIERRLEESQGKGINFITKDVEALLKEYLGPNILPMAKVKQLINKNTIQSQSLPTSRYFNAEGLMKDIEGALLGSQKVKLTAYAYDLNKRAEKSSDAILRDILASEKGNIAKATEKAVLMMEDRLRGELLVSMQLKEVLSGEDRSPHLAKDAVIRILMAKAPHIAEALIEKDESLQSQLGKVLANNWSKHGQNYGSLDNTVERIISLFSSDYREFLQASFNSREFSTFVENRLVILQSEDNILKIDSFFEDLKSGKWGEGDLTDFHATAPFQGDMPYFTPEKAEEMNRARKDYQRAEFRLDRNNIDLTELSQSNASPLLRKGYDALTKKYTVLESKKKTETDKIKMIVKEYAMNSKATLEELKEVRRLYHEALLEESSINGLRKQQSGLLEEMSGHKVNLNPERKETFLQSHFNLLDLLNTPLKERETVRAVFTPPKFLDLTSDIRMTDRDIHGLNVKELIRQGELDKAEMTVLNEASLVKARV